MVVDEKKRVMRQIDHIMHMSSCQRLVKETRPKCWISQFQHTDYGIPPEMAAASGEKRSEQYET